MAPYSRALLQFAYAAMAAGHRVEAFVFGTRLTCVTRTLRTKDSDRAMREIGRQVFDWGGGTRIGESLKACSTGGASARRSEAGWSCSAPTVSSAVIRSSSGRRWRACAASRSASSSG